MKILFVLDTFYPKIDGPATVIYNIANILTEKKLAEIDVLVPGYKNYKDNFNFKVIRCASMFGPDNYRTGLPALSFNLKKKLKENNYDIIHIHSPFTMGKYATKFGIKNKIPVINTIHTQYKSDFERKLKSKFLQNFMMRYVAKVLNGANKILTVSSGFAKEINTTYGYSKKVDVIRNATEFVDTKDLSQQVKDIKAKHNVNDKFICLFVGRVVENKNIQFSLDALNEVKKQGVNNFKFLIVGEGNYMNELKKKVSEYNLEDNVDFVGLIKDRDLLSAYYKSADLFMFPSTFDTCGIVALESASFGTPSIMLKGSYASELIENGKNGFIAEANAKDWANIISDLINNQTKVKEIRDYTKQSLYKSWEDISFEYYNFYKLVMLVDNIKKKKTIIYKKEKTLKSCTNKQGKYKFFKD